VINVRTFSLRRARACALAVGACVAAFSASGCGIVHSTGPTQVGVRVNILTGLEDRIYAPGSTYFFIPFINDWYAFDVSVQTLSMVAHSGSDHPSDLAFKTRDGNDIAADVTVQYRMLPEKAAVILQTVGTTDQEVKEKLVRPLARSIVRDALNELNSEGFYISDKRFAAAEKASEELNKAFAQYGLVCEKVALIDYRFHAHYQQAIDAKKVADQAVNKNRSAAEAAIQEYQRNLETKKGDVEKQIAEADGGSAQVRLSADAYYFTRQKDAQAIRKLGEAVAGSGGRTMVKLRLAEALTGKRILLLPSGEGGVSLNRTDINDLVKMLTLEGEKDRKKSEREGGAEPSPTPSEAKSEN